MFDLTPIVSDSPDMPLEYFVGFLAFSKICNGKTEEASDREETLATLRKARLIYNRHVLQLSDSQNAITPGDILRRLSRMGVRQDGNNVIINSIDRDKQAARFLAFLITHIMQPDRLGRYFIIRTCIQVPTLIRIWEEAAGYLNYDTRYEVLRFCAELPEGLDVGIIIEITLDGEEAPPEWRAAKERYLVSLSEFTHHTDRLPYLLTQHACQELRARVNAMNNGDNCNDFIIAFAMFEEGIRALSFTGDHVTTMRQFEVNPTEDVLLSADHAAQYGDSLVAAMAVLGGPEAPSRRCRAALALIYLVTKLESSVRSANPSGKEGGAIIHFRKDVLPKKVIDVDFGMNAEIRKQLAGPSRENATDLLARIIADSNDSPEVRAYACRALAILNRTSAQSAVAKIIHDAAENEYLRIEVIKLAAFYKWKDIVGPLTHALLEPSTSANVVASIETSLGLIGDPNSVADLSRGLKHDAGPSTEAIVALGDINTPEAVHILLGCSSDNLTKCSLEARITAIEMLCRTAEVEYLECFVEHLKSESSSKICAAALMAIEQVAAKHGIVPRLPINSHGGTWLRLMRANSHNKHLLLRENRLRHMWEIVIGSLAKPARDASRNEEVVEKVRSICEENRANPIWKDATRFNSYLAVFQRLKFTDNESYMALDGLSLILEDVGLFIGAGIKTDSLSLQIFADEVEAEVKIIQTNLMNGLLNIDLSRARQPTVEYLPAIESVRIEPSIALPCSDTIEHNLLLSAVAPIQKKLSVESKQWTKGIITISKEAIFLRKGRGDQKREIKIYIEEAKIQNEWVMTLVALGAFKNACKHTEKSCDRTCEVLFDDLSEMIYGSDEDSLLIANARRRLNRIFKKNGINVGLNIDIIQRAQRRRDHVHTKQSKYHGCKINSEWRVEIKEYPSPECKALADRIRNNLRS